MHTMWAVVALALLVFYLLLMARVIVEITRSFAHAWRPAGMAAVGLETVYTVTDPPVRLVRRLIKPVRLGSVVLDLSVFLVLIMVLVLRMIATHLAVP